MKNIISLETVLRNIELKESKLLNWCRNYKPGVSNASLETKMLLNHANDITIFEEQLHAFFGGDFVSKDNIE